MKVYLWNNKAFTDYNIFASHILMSKIPGLGTLQDCLDWIVYAYYIDLDLNSTNTISYGIIKNDGNTTYFYDLNEFNDYVKLNQIEDFEWFDSITII